MIARVAISIIGATIEIISILLFFVVVFYVYNIRTISRGINGWNYIASGFLLIIFRRFFGLLLGKQIWLLNSEPTGVIIALVESFILLLITVLFIIGFYKLNKSFDEIEDGKLKDRKGRKRR